MLNLVKYLLGSSFWYLLAFENVEIETGTKWRSKLQKKQKTKEIKKFIYKEPETSVTQTMEF